MLETLFGICHEVDDNRLREVYYTWSGTFEGLPDLETFQASQILGVKFLFYMSGTNAVAAKLRSISARVRKADDLRGRPAKENANVFSYFYELEKIVFLSRSELATRLGTGGYKGERGWAVYLDGESAAKLESYLDAHKSALPAPCADPLDMDQAAESLAAFYRVKASQISICIERDRVKS